MLGYLVSLVTFLYPKPNKKFSKYLLVISNFGTELHGALSDMFRELLCENFSYYIFFLVIKIYENNFNLVKCFLYLNF